LSINFTIPGTYILNSSNYEYKKHVIVEQWGAGAAGDNCYGNGGASGGYFKAYFETKMRDFTIIIGSGGLGQSICCLNSAWYNGKYIQKTYFDNGSDTTISTNDGFINITAGGGQWINDKISYGGNNSYELDWPYEIFTSQQGNSAISNPIMFNYSPGYPAYPCGCTDCGFQDYTYTIGGFGGNSPNSAGGGIGATNNYGGSNVPLVQSASDGMYGGGGGGSVTNPCNLYGCSCDDDVVCSGGSAGNGGDGRVNMMFFN